MEFEAGMKKTPMRDARKSERLDVRAWREYHVRVLKGKLF